MFGNVPPRPSSIGTAALEPGVVVGDDCGIVDRGVGHAAARWDGVSGWLQQSLATSVWLGVLWHGSGSVMSGGKTLENNSKNGGSIGLDSRSLCATGCIWILIGRLFCAIALLPSVLAMAEQPKAGRGFSYHHDEISAVPWSIHVIKVDRSAQDLEFHTTLAKGTILGLSTLTEQLKSLPAEGDDQLPESTGTIIGPRERVEAIERPPDPRGELVSGRATGAAFGSTPLAILTSTRSFRNLRSSGQMATKRLSDSTRNGRDVAVLYTPILGPSTRTTGGRALILERESSGQWLPLRASQMYTARVRQVRETGDTPLAGDVMILSLGPQLAPRVPKVKPGDSLKISTSTLPDLTGVKTAIGGGPALVRNGKVAEWQAAQSRHPRSNRLEQNPYLSRRSGRSTEESVRRNDLRRVGHLMIKLGCEEAMNWMRAVRDALVFSQSCQQPFARRRTRHGQCPVLIQRKNLRSS